MGHKSQYDPFEVKFLSICGPVKYKASYVIPKYNDDTDIR